MTVPSPGIDPLLDPLAYLAATGSSYDWFGRTELTLDDRYRRRQLPLLHTQPRTAVSQTAMRDAEFWPPARSLVLPLPDELLRKDAALRRFLDGLEASAAAHHVWFDGLDLRSDRVHATLVPGFAQNERPRRTAVAASTASVSDRAIHVDVRGPFVGRYNTGRIYLAVQAADRRSADALRAIRREYGIGDGTLLAGYVQLKNDVTGSAYGDIRDLVQTYQAQISIRMSFTDLWLMDTMDDLVLRSEVIERISVASLCS